MDGTKWMTRCHIDSRPNYAEQAIPIRLFGYAVAVLALGKAWGKSVHLLLTLVWFKKLLTLWTKLFVGFGRYFGLEPRIMLQWQASHQRLE